jgi:WD40 repeat protein
VVILNLSDYKLAQVEKLDHEYPVCCTFVGKSDDLAVGNATEITLYKTVGGQRVATRFGKGMLLSPVALLASTGRLIILCTTGEIWFFDLKTEQLAKQHDLKATIRCGCISQDCTTVAVGLRTGEIALLSAETGKLTARFQAHAEEVRSTSLVDKDTLLSGSADGTIKNWSLQQVKRPQMVITASHKVLSVCMVNEDIFCAGLLDGTVEAYSIRTGKLQFQIQGVFQSDAHSLVSIRSNLFIALGTDRCILCSVPGSLSRRRELAPAPRLHP